MSCGTPEKGRHHCGSRLVSSSSDSIPFARSLRLRIAQSNTLLIVVAAKTTCSMCFGPTPKHSTHPRQFGSLSRVSPAYDGRRVQWRPNGSACYGVRPPPEALLTGSREGLCKKVRGLAGYMGPTLAEEAWPRPDLGVGRMCMWMWQRTNQKPELAPGVFQRR